MSDEVGFLDWVIVGLGNPGPSYAAHRHNVGFVVIDHLKSTVLSPDGVMKFSSLLSVVQHQGKRLYIQKPMVYMNNSGRPVADLLNFYKIDLARLVVVHDDLDLPLGKVKVKQGGGTGGHNGLKSISSAVGGDGYVRVRIGIGRPKFDNQAVADYVLSPFSKADEIVVRGAVELAVGACLSVIDKGVAVAMNEVNGLV